jgi:hypothetical protein
MTTYFINQSGAAETPTNAPNYDNKWADKIVLLPVSSLYTIHTTTELTFTNPGIASVKKGITYRFKSSIKRGAYDPITGNFTNPGTTNVKNGIVYKFNSNTQTGTYDPITGNFTNPGIANVKYGIIYKFNSDSLMGKAKCRCRNGHPI